MQPQFEKKVFSHNCVGGTLDGRPVTSRFPDGFLLVDKSNNLVLVYRYNFYTDVWESDGAWEVWDRNKSWEAAEGSSYDVIALGAGGI